MMPFQKHNEEKRIPKILPRIRQLIAGDRTIKPVPLVWRHAMLKSVYNQIITNDV